MKVIIAGSRYGVKYQQVCDAMSAARSAGIEPTEIVSGSAGGADKLGEFWAREHGIPVKRFPAHWCEYGKSAGPRRNRAMAEYADALVAIWVNGSRGTSSMVAEARRVGLKAHVVEIDTRAST